MLYKRKDEDTGGRCVVKGCDSVLVPEGISDLKDTGEPLITDRMMDILFQCGALDPKFSEDKYDYAFFVSPNALTKLSHEEVKRKPYLHIPIFTKKNHKFIGYKVIVVCDMEGREIYFGRKYE
jgi:hypothetical protein